MEVGSLDPECLVFVDEMGTHTFFAPLYTYSPVSERACFEIPRNLKAGRPLGLTPEDGQTRVSDTGSVEGGPKDAGSNTTLYTGVQSRGGEVGPLLTG
jgi:hypothetical protein